MVPVFQPIMSLPDEADVGFEAMACWPTIADCPPDRAFAHAGAIDTVGALDRLCIDTSIAAALRSPLSRSALLCVNAVPSSAYVSRADDAILARGYDQLTVMFDHRTSPARSSARTASEGGRDAGGRFHDRPRRVSANPDSLALLDLVRPDVTKLDMAMVQSQPSRAQARTAPHERTDAVILAEGIANNEHLEQALTVGATLGQGNVVHRPGA